MKRKQPNEGFSVSQTFKQLKTSDAKCWPSGEVIRNSLIWLNVALLAKDGNHEPLAELDAKEKDLSNIDWNTAVPIGPRRGVTLAFLAAELRLDNKPTLMRILLSSPAANLQRLNWDAGPRDEKHEHFGITLAWMALYFNQKEMGKGLLTLLCKQPESALKKLNWNAYPKNRSPVPDISLVWMVASNNYHRKHYHSETTSTKLAEILMNSYEELGDFNWNSCPPPDQEDFNRNINLAWFAAAAYPSNRDNGFLNKLMQSPMQVLERINWNSRPDVSDGIADFEDDSEYTLAFFAFRIFNVSFSWCLLDTLVTLPIHVFKKIDWNAGPVEDQTAYHGGISLAWGAAYLALEYSDDRLLEKLSESGPSNLLWNVAPCYESRVESEFNDGIFQYFGVNLIWMGVILATSEPANTALLELFLNSPARTLEAIDWNERLENDNHEDSEEESEDEKPEQPRETLFTTIVCAIPEKLPTKYCKNLFHEKIVSKLIWNERLTAKIIEFMNDELPELDFILPQLSQPLLKSLQDKVNESKEHQETLMHYYLNFLVEFTSGAELSLVSTQFIQEFPLKLITAYQNIPTSSPVFARAQFELASWYLMKEELKPDELKCSMVTDLEHESPRQVKVANAFYHACHWFHYQTEEKSNSKNSFISSIVKNIFSSDGKMGKKFPTQLQQETETFLVTLSECDDPELLPLLIERFRGMVQNQRLEHEIREFSSPALSLSSLKK
jgi:hypothetical protein